jgi:uncharacterized protein YciI
MATRTILLLVILHLVALSGGGIAMAEDTNISDAKKTFLVLYRPGPNWDPAKRVWEQQLGGHKDYLIDRYADGALKFAGPFTDDWGGGVVVQVATIEVAAEIAKHDPAVMNGIFTFEIHPWFLVNWDEALAQRETGAREKSSPQ